MQQDAAEGRLTTNICRGSRLGCSVVTLQSVTWRHKTLLSPPQVAFCTYEAYRVGRPDSRL